MAKIILNKDLETEYTLDVTTVNEDINVPILTGSKQYLITEATPAPTIPELPTKVVTTVIAQTDDGLNIPIVGIYNTVANLSTTFLEDPARYSVHISVVNEAE